MNRAIQNSLAAKGELTAAAREISEEEAKRLIERNLDRIIADPLGDWGGQIGQKVGGTVVKRLGKKIVKKGRGHADEVLGFV